MPELLRRLLWMATGGPPRLVLKRKGTSFTLSSFRGKSATNINPLLRKAKLVALTNLPAESLSALRVPVAQLYSTRRLLQETTDVAIQIEIMPDVLGLSLIECPKEFSIFYEWAKDGFTRRFSMTAEYCEAGWFVSQSQLWQLPFTPEDDGWLRLSSLAGEKIIQLLCNVLPDWRQRNLPVQCEITYKDEPALQVCIKKVTDKIAELNVLWCNDPQEIAPAPSLHDHVIVGASVRPGIAPQALGLLGKQREPDLTLEDEDIPKFIRDLLPRVHQWTAGAVSELLQRHQILDLPGSIVLRVERMEKDGVGSATAIPEFVCGNVRGNAEQISYALNETRGFVRVGVAWVPVNTIKNAGIGPFGREIHGAVLGRTTLTPAEVLSRRLKQSTTAWPVDFPEIEYPVLASDLNPHLSFLLHWGIPGGIAGDWEPTTQAIRGCVAQLKNTHCDCRVLVIANKERVEAAKATWDALVTSCFTSARSTALFPTNGSGIFLSTPKAFEEIPQLGLTPWTLLILLEADTLIKTAHSSFFEHVCRCEALLALGSFTSTAFLGRNAQREALARAFKIPSGPDGELVWKYGVRDPKIPAQKLPALPRSLPARQGPSEHIVGQPGMGGIPIPPRKSTPQHIDLEKLGIRIQVTFSTGDDSFLETARKMAGYKGGASEPAPFESYRPTYSLMSAQQKSWYFYWRSQVRSGVFPDVDLSYIFLHIYELIHHVGSQNAEDGYRQLRTVWLNYRERHSRLDSYLPDWLADYILVNRCNIDPLQPYTEMLAFERPITQPDLLFQRYINGGGYSPPLTLLLSYSNYNLCRSKFYNEQTRAVLAERLPQSFVYLDEARVCPGQKRLAEAYRPVSTKTVSRTPFLGAVYAGHREPITLGIAYPYSLHPPFRVIVTSFFKYSENKLRQTLKHKSLLRGIELPQGMQALLDAYFAKHGLVALPRRQIEIDSGRVQELQAESDEIREMLLEDTRETGPATPESDRAAPLNEGSGDFSLNGHSRNFVNDALFRLFHSLSEAEVELIRALVNLGWESDDPLIKSKIGDCFLENMIERINQLSLRDVGDLLIVTEADRRIVNEDFREELGYCLAHAGDALLHDRTGSDGLPAEWHELRSRLDDGQRHALAIISTEQDVSKALEHLARGLGLMPEVLVEGINEIAQNTIGDIIVDLGASPPVLEQENREFVEKMLAPE